VFAGTQNLTGVVEVEVTRVGEDTTIGRVRELILAAEKTKLPIMRIMDRYLGYYTPAVLMIVALVWFFTDDWTRVVSLLVIACPCALILATPTAMVAALSAAARHGILVKNVADLEGASRLDAGLRQDRHPDHRPAGRGTLAPWKACCRQGPAVGRGQRGALQQASGRAGPAAPGAATGLALAEPEDFHEEAGQGVRARVNGEPVLSGRATWLRSQGVARRRCCSAMTRAARKAQRDLRGPGRRYLGWIGLQDQVRPGAAEALAELRELRHQAGGHDHRRPAGRGPARWPDIWAARIHRGMPAQQHKVEFVNRVKAEGYRVAFVGDGVNDAPALAAGDTGIAMGAAGSDVAIHSASVALMSNDLRRLPFLIRLSRMARQVVFQNIAVGGCSSWAAWSSPAWAS
jgi:Cd2+/Zn2+-exporting ATPase